jgi:hypothetical protein
MYYEKCTRSQCRVNIFEVDYLQTKARPYEKKSGTVCLWGGVAGERNIVLDTRNFAAGCYTVRMLVGAKMYVKSVPILR